MQNLVPGMLARSLAGHDKGRLFVILKTGGEYLWLCDGKCRTVEKPKKKKRMHVQIICREEKSISEALAEGKMPRDEAVRRFLAQVQREES